jgi:hypothetical protein
MEAALMDTLKEIMGGEWSAALEAAWKDLYYKLSRVTPPSNSRPVSMDIAGFLG